MFKKIRVNPWNPWETYLRLYSDYIPPIIFSPTDFTDFTDYFSPTQIFIFSHGSHGSHGFYPPHVVAKLTTKSVESHVQEISLISLIRIHK